MTRIHKAKVYLTPKDASRFTSLPRAMLACYVRRGVLTHYRTEGNHRRYDLDELRTMRKARATDANRR